MTNYQILSAATPLRLQTKVRDALQNGWQLQGGVVTRAREFFQAVTRHEPIGFVQGERERKGRK